MKKMQIRLTLDEEMGPFFKWLSERPQKVRAREFIAVARTGFGVLYGVRVPADVAVSADAAAPVRAAPAALTTLPRTLARQSAVCAFGPSFVVATPPIQ